MQKPTLSPVGGEGREEERRPPVCSSSTSPRPAYDVVARVKRLLRAQKAGHTGTLDPLATGVLVVCLGEAVKLQRWLTDGDKAYEALVAFGAATTTEDAEGEVVERGDPGPLDDARIRAALPRFIGVLEQVPPMFSAVRVGGRRLHEAARAGEVVERTPRQVRVDAFELLELGEPAAGSAARLAVRWQGTTCARWPPTWVGRWGPGPPRRAAAGPQRGASRWRTRSPWTRLRPRRHRSGGPRRAGAAARGGAARLADRAPHRRRGARDLGHGKALPLPSAPVGLCGALAPHGRLLAVCEGRAGTLRPLRVLGPSIR